jgi:hypothetical protein
MAALFTGENAWVSFRIKERPMNEAIESFAPIIIESN